MKILKSFVMIAKGIKMNGLYILDGSTVIAQVVVGIQNQHDKTNLWHMRFGHVSEKSLLKLAKQNLSEW